MGPSVTLGIHFGPNSAAVLKGQRWAGKLLNFLLFSHILIFHPGNTRLWDGEEAPAHGVLRITSLFSRDQAPLGPSVLIWRPSTVQFVQLTWFRMKKKKKVFLRRKSRGWFSRPLPRIWLGILRLRDGKSNVSINSGMIEKKNVWLFISVPSARKRTVCVFADHSSVRNTHCNLGRGWCLRSLGSHHAAPGTWFLQRCVWRSPPSLGWTLW